MPTVRWSRIAVALVGFMLPAALVAALVIVQLGDDDGQPAVPPSEKRAARGESFLAKLIPPPVDRPTGGLRVPAGISELAGRMPAERKVAQLFLLGFKGQDLTAPIYRRLRERDLGGIVIDAPNYVSSDQLASLAGEARVIAEDAGHVRPWVMAPQEGGELNAFPDLPPASSAADLRSDADAFDEASQAAATLSGLGLTGVLAPVADVALPDGPALGARAYSDVPREVSTYVAAVVEAYRARRVLTAAGHFPGLGLGLEDTRLGVSQVSSTVDQLRRRDLIPFRAAIRAGVPAVLMSNGLYTTDDFVTPGSLSRALMVDLLRGELGFTGLAITDDLADPSVTSLISIPEAAVRAIKAGADLLYVSGPATEQDAAYDAVLRAVQSGRITKQRLDQALVRGLAIKQGYGLIEPAR
jgi:beta-N-acetylhexosaminidase